MNPEEARAAPAAKLDRFGIAELMERIVLDRDVNLVDRFVRRKAFLWQGGKRLDLAEYVQAWRSWLLKQARKGTGPDIVDAACDLTIDKFTRLPEPSFKKDPEEDDADYSRVDCRRYYRAFLSSLAGAIPADRSPLEREAFIEARFQKFVNRHLYLSLKEARRKLDPHAHRYLWRINGRSLSFRMPRAMSGDEKRQWLEIHVPESWLAGPFARQRIQTLVDEELLAHAAGRHLIELKHALNPPETVPVRGAEQEFSAKGMAGALADEKADSVDTLRPAVRALGRERVRQLVLDVVDDLRHERFNQRELGRKYGLSPATVSRFCGARWTERQKTTGYLEPPDLWVNLAGLFAGHPGFRRAAHSARVWDAVLSTASVKNGDVDSKPEESKENSDAT